MLMRIPRVDTHNRCRGSIICKNMTVENQLTYVSKYVVLRSYIISFISKNHSINNAHH